MRPSPFDYAAPHDLAEAVRLLADDDERTVLAGGQSLLPVLRMRLGNPTMVVDLSRVTDLRAVRLDGDDLVVGAMATHHEVAHDPLVREHAGLLAQAASVIGDPQIRYRGTLGGALAHADPAGDLGPAVLALDATLEITGPDGTRSVPAADFFTFHFTTDLGPAEILTAVRVRRHDGWGSAYEKFHQVAQSWSIVGVAGVVRVEDSRIAEVRLAMANMGSTPVRAPHAERALVGVAVEADAVRAACAAAGQGTTPPDDPGGTPDYRRHLAGVLAARAVMRAAGSST